MTILITGMNGFIGQAVAARASAHGLAVRGAVRKRPAVIGPGNLCAVGDIGTLTDWDEALTGCRAVVHLAAHVHRRSGTAADEAMLYRRTNFEGTMRLASAAARRGVERFVFLSSIKVNGEGRDHPYNEEDRPQPADAYALSKWQAEQGLLGLARETGMAVLILRSPLVYGPGVKANFLSLMRAVDRGWPLPFGAVDNRRSLVFVDNLADAILRCLEAARAPTGTYLLSDGEALSTAELVRNIAGALDRPMRLWSLPPELLTAAGAVLGRGDVIRRLIGSLTADDGKFRREFGWQPPCETPAGVEATARWYRRQGQETIKPQLRFAG